MKLLKKRHISITDKFILYFVSFNFIAGFIITIVLFYSARDSILARAGEQLTSVRVVKKRQIESFFADCYENAQNASYFFSFVSNPADSCNLDGFLKHLVSANRNFDGCFIASNNSRSILAKELPGANEQELRCLSELAAQFAAGDVSSQLFDFTEDRAGRCSGLYLLSDARGSDFVIGFRISAQRINEIMLENKPNEGLGNSGESYLIGHDLTMRSKSRFIDSSQFRTKVRTESSSKAIGGISETQTTFDYRGIKVLSSFAPLEIPGLRWAVLAEIDFDEVLIPINQMLTKTIFLAIGFSLLIFFTTFFISKGITKPLIKLKDATKRIAQHQYSEVIEVQSNDEIGELTESFNAMAKAIAEKEKELSEERIARYAAVLDGQDSERARLARDLHDGIGQTLVALKLRLESISCEKAAIENGFMDNIKQQIDQVIDDLRSISNNLMPSVLVEFGIESAIGNICSSLSDISNIEFNPTVELRNGIKDEKTKIYIFRILQEAINNIIKHSNAKRALVQLTEKKHSFYLRVKDDGTGFNPRGKRKAQGNGLYSIRERVLFLGGKLKLDSSDGSGTDIQIIIPKRKSMNGQN